MSKTVTNDPFVQVRNAVLETVAKAKAQQDKFFAQFQAETEKAQKAAVEGIDKAAAAQRANLDASVLAAKAALEGFGKIGELTQAHINALVDARVAGAEKLFSVKDVATAAQLNIELIKAEQAKQVELAEAVAKLAEAVAQDVLKPIQVQAEANVKALQEQAEEGVKVVKAQAEANVKALNDLKAA